MHRTTFVCKNTHLPPSLIIQSMRARVAYAWRSLYPDIVNGPIQKNRRWDFKKTLKEIVLFVWRFHCHSEPEPIVGAMTSCFWVYQSSCCHWHKGQYHFWLGAGRLYESVDCMNRQAVQKNTDHGAASQGDLLAVELHNIRQEHCKKDEVNLNQLSAQSSECKRSNYIPNTHFWKKGVVQLWANNFGPFRFWKKERFWKQQETT
jgi:hypothetical protein